MAKHFEQPVDRFPLAWPVGWPRTPAGQRRRIEECDRIGAQGPVLSTNLELRMDGQPRADAKPVDGDPGVAIYFRHKGRPIVFACDKWDRVPDNIAAIARHIWSIRCQDRWGVGRLEQALAGYQRLLSGKRAWFEVLGFVSPPAHWSHIEDASASRSCARRRSEAT